MSPSSPSLDCLGPCSFPYPAPSVPAPVRASRGASTCHLGRRSHKGFPCHRRALGHPPPGPSLQLLCSPAPLLPRPPPSCPPSTHTANAHVPGAHLSRDPTCPSAHLSWEPTQASATNSGSRSVPLATCPSVHPSWEPTCPRSPPVPLSTHHQSPPTLGMTSLTHPFPYSAVAAPPEKPRTPLDQTRPSRSPHRGAGTAVEDTHGAGGSELLSLHCRLPRAQGAPLTPTGSPALLGAVPVQSTTS